MKQVKKKETIELRSYKLSRDFPVLLLNGEKWRISDIPSDILHFHNCTEIGLCCSDQGILVRKFEKHAFQEGDVTFISSGVAHTTYSQKNTQSKWCYLFVDLEELLLPYFSCILSECSATRALDKINEDFFKIVSDKKNQYYHQLVKMMIMVLEEEKPNYETVFRSLMLAFVMSMMNEADSEPIHDESDMTSRLRIEPAISYIHQNYQNSHLSIEKLSSLCNLSLTHFRRLFQVSMNATPLNYVNLIRVKEAKKLLTTTNDTVLSIAEEVGFHSVSSLNRQFLKKTNMTPSDWRKKKGSVSESHLIEYNGWLEPPQHL